MKEPAATPRRRWWKYLLVLCGAVVLAASVLLWYVNTESFQAMVRRRLVAEVERITGGRAEIGSFHTQPFLMQVDVRDITVHGLEAVGEVPLAHADRIVARVKVISILRTEFGFHEVILDHPVIHLAFYPDGSTNVPARKMPRGSGSALDPLFALSISRFEVRHGELLGDDQSIPLDFTAREVALQMDYSYLRGRYEGRLLVGKVDTKLQNQRPFAWMTTLDFSVGPTVADISSLKWNSAHSHLEANARVSDFRHPKVQASYEAQIDLGEAASIARRRDLRTGILDIKGEGQWSLDQFSANGEMTLRDLAWQSDYAAFSKASIAGGYFLTGDQLKVSKLRGKLLGGTFVGDAEINHWLSPPQHISEAARKAFEASAGNVAVISVPRPEVSRGDRKSGALGRNREPGMETGSIHLRLRDFSAEEIAAALNAPARGLGNLRPTAAASGTLDVLWKGAPQDAKIDFAVEATPSAHRAGQLPFTAQAGGVYRASTEALELSRFTLSTPATHVSAAGTFSSDSALHVSVSTSSLEEWQPLISAFRGPAKLPVTLHSSVTFTGSLSGGFSAPTLTGTLLVDDFDVTVPASASAAEREVHWDSFFTSVQLSSRAIAFRGASLHRDNTAAEFDASAALQRGRFTEDGQFTLRLSLHNADVSALQAILGRNYPITGTADVSLQAAGSKSDPHGQGQVHLTNASAYGEPIQRFNADLRFAQGEAGLYNIHLVQGDSSVAGSAAYNPSTRAFRLDLSGNNFDLSRIRQIRFDSMPVAGRADFALKGSGTPDAPSINGEIHIRALALDDQTAGEFDLQAVTQGRELHLTGSSHLQHGSMLLDGNVQLRDQYLASLSLRMENLAVDAVVNPYVHGKFTGPSVVTGLLEMHGPLFQPSQWTVDGALSDVFLNVENVKLHNQDPIRFEVANRTIHIGQLHMLGEGTDLTAHGSVQISGPRELDLSAEGRFDLKLLSGVDPNFAATGLVSLSMTVAGTLTEPLPQGRLQFTNGSVSYAGLPSGLSALNGSVIFSRDQAHIESLSARTGGGGLDLKGDAAYKGQQFNFNLTATGKDVRLRYPPGVSSTANAEIHWVGTRSASTVSGDVMVTKIAVMPGFDFGSYLDRSRQISTVSAANSPLYAIKLDIRVHTSPELQMRTAVARLSGDADLRLRGSVARPAVLGRADILEGQATMHGTKFTLERGDITFVDPVSITPVLNLQAYTHVRDYDLSITVTGTPDRLNVNYRSEPPLPKSDIIALLALGRTNEESEQLQEQSGQTPFTDDATAIILNQALNTTVSSRLQRLFGASNIKIDPQGLSTETNPTARGPQVTIEQEFVNNVSLTYSTNVSQSSQQIIEGEYYFNRNFSLVGTRDQNGVVSFDVRIRRRSK